jgi:hypothetical protein
MAKRQYIFNLVDKLKNVNNLFPLLKTPSALKLDGA